MSSYNLCSYITNSLHDKLSDSVKVIKSAAGEIIRTKNNGKRHPSFKLAIVPTFGFALVILVDLGDVGVHAEIRDHICLE